MIASGQVQVGQFATQFARGQVVQTPVEEKQLSENEMDQYFCKTFIKTISKAKIKFWISVLCQKLFH